MPARIIEAGAIDNNQVKRLPAFQSNTCLAVYITEPRLKQTLESLYKEDYGAFLYGTTSWEVC